MQEPDSRFKVRFSPPYIPLETYTCQLKTCTLYTMFQTLFSSVKGPFHAGLNAC